MLEIDLCRPQILASYHSRGFCGEIRSDFDERIAYDGEKRNTLSVENLGLGCFPCRRITQQKITDQEHVLAYQGDSAQGRNRAY